MKLAIKPGSTSELLDIFIQDSSSTTGAGLTGLTNASSGLVCYYARADQGNAGGTAISLASATLGTWTSGGFKEKDATNMPGVYEFGITNAAINTGSRNVLVMLKGATNMAPLLLEIDLKAQVSVTHWNDTAVATPATAGVVETNVKNMNNVAATSITTINANQGTVQPVKFTGSGANAYVQVDVIGFNGTTVTARDIGASVLLSAGTGTGQLDFTSGVVKANVTQFGGSAGTFASGRPEVNTTHFRGTISAGTAGYVGPDWSAINSPTSTVSLSNTTIATVTTVTTVTNLTNAPTAGDFTSTMKTSLNAATPAVTVSDKTGFKLASDGLALVISWTVDITGTWTGNLTGYVGYVSEEILSFEKTVTSSTSTTVTTNENTATGVDTYRIGCLVKVYPIGSPSKAQTRTIIGQTTNIVQTVYTVDSAWDTNPTGGSTYYATTIRHRSPAFNSSMHVTLADASLVTAKLGTFALAKTTNITGFNDLSAAQVNTEADTALSDVGLTTTITGRIDVAVSTRLATSSYTAPDNAGISTISTNVSTLLSRIGSFTGTGVNTILGFFKALLSKSASTPSDVGGTFDASTDSTEAIQELIAAGSFTLSSAYDFAKGTVAMTQSYAANGVAPTPVQAIYAIHQYLMDFTISGVNYTVKKLDNSATAFVVTLNDATTPTAASRT